MSGVVPRQQRRSGGCRPVVSGRSGHTAVPPGVPSARDTAGSACLDGKPTGNAGPLGVHPQAGRQRPKPMALHGVKATRFGHCSPVRLCHVLCQLLCLFPNPPPGRSPVKSGVSCTLLIILNCAGWKSIHALHCCCILLLLCAWVLMVTQKGQGARVKAQQRRATSSFSLRSRY